MTHCPLVEATAPETTLPTYTVAQAIAALKLTCNRKTVTRHCVKLGMQKHGRDWALTDADLKKLKKSIQPRPGKPNKRKS